MEYYGYADESEPAWVGTKRRHERSEGKLDAALTEKRHKCDDDSWTAVAAYGPVAGTKRAYERSQDSFDLTIDKRYKCNYWEDPAHALILRLRGGRKATTAALINQSQRAAKEVDDWCDAREAERKSKM